MNWFVNISSPDLVPVKDEVFKNLEDALTHVGQTYLEEPYSVDTDNAQCCIKDGQLNFIYLRGVFCKFKPEYKHLFAISIAAENAFKAWHMESAAQQQRH